MRYRPGAWATVFGIIFVLAACSTKQTTQKDLGAFVSEYEKKIEYVERSLAQEQWEYFTLGYSDSLAFYHTLYRDLHADQDRLQDIKSVLALADDPALKRRLEIIYGNYLRGVVTANGAVARLVDSLQTISRVRRIVFEGSSTTTAELRSILKHDDNAARRREAYTVLTSPDHELIAGLASLARLRNQVVARFGYNSYFDLMLIADGLDRSDMNDILRQVDEWSRDAYKVMLDSLKNSLGIDSPGPWDIERALYAAEDAAAGYLPATGQMALADATMSGLGIKLGALPIYFADQDSSFADPVGHSLPIHVPDDIRVPTFLADGLPSVRRLFRQLGEALYLSNIEQDEAILARPSAPCFRYGMADVISHFASMDGWLRKYAGMPEPMVMQVHASRSALRLYHLRLLLVQIMFEKQLYANPSGDITAAYRSLFEQYMMIPAVGGSIPTDLVMGYITDPVQHQNELVGKCVRAQVYRYLRERYGSVLDNERTREFMVHNFYRFGALDNWKTLLQRGTGEPLNVSYLIIDSGN